MAAYADLTYYTGTYLGSTIAASDFPRLALRASAVIDGLTFGLAGPVVTTATDTATIELIKMATCAVAEEIQILSENEGGGEIASERVGNHSVTYVSSKSAALSDGVKLANAAKLYLGLTGLMYRGLDEDAA